MPSWNDILTEVQDSTNTPDSVRRKYLEQLQNETGRNVIIYYSGWLDKPNLGGLTEFHVRDTDKNGFMSAVHGLDRDRGLDLILHTPGGDAAATESIVYYLRQMFETDVRAIVPQIAMSAGTMIACACDQIVMGEHSSLGPIDPQIGGYAAHGILEEFRNAKDEINNNPSNAAVWQPIIGKYNPTLIGECRKAIAWTENMVTDWLKSGMFSGDNNPGDRAEEVVNELADHALQKSHRRHISPTKAEEIGLDVLKLESDDDLQEAVLSVHHAALLTFTQTAAVKIIENHDGAATIRSVAVNG